MSHEAVQDWGTDFDHTDPTYVANPYPIFDAIRESGCPIAHTQRYGGAWLPTTHADVAAIANDTEHFTSRSIVATNHRPPLELAPSGIAPPISADPPYHQESRRTLLPIFSPQRIAELEPSTRAYCQQLLAGIEGKNVVDAAVDYAQHIPVRVIADMLGLPPGDADLFRGFVHTVLEGVAWPIEQRIAGFQALFDYLMPRIEERMREPQQDIISLLLDTELNGAKLNPFEVGRTIALLLIAGIDTTWSAIGASIWHLAHHPSDLARLVDEADLLPTAIEEFLRMYAPVTMARLVKDDFDFNGCPMKAEEWILLSFPAANRDPAFFDRADEFIIDRQNNRHAAFGLGIHRCAGSHLARMEMRVALEEWIKAFPSFTLADPDAVTWSAGQVRGPRVLPIKIG